MENGMVLQESEFKFKKFLFLYAGGVVLKEKLV